MLDGHTQLGLIIGQLGYLPLFWAIRALRERRLIPFDYEQFRALIAGGGLGVGANAWATSAPAAAAVYNDWPDLARLVIGILGGVFFQALGRALTKGVSDSGPVQPPGRREWEASGEVRLVPPAAFPDHPPTGTHPMAHAAWERRQRSKDQ
ncbi:hypothetical protein IT575_12235 [bacterium]|nr:hypothetical protein [bacterium]